MTSCIPTVKLDKRANLGSVSAGAIVTYSYTVTNTGDCALYEVRVTDDVLGLIGTISRLGPGESFKFTKKTTVVTEVTNIGTVIAHDELGGPKGTVEDNDDEIVVMTKGQPEEPEEPTTPTQIEQAPQVSKVQAKATTAAIATQDALPYTGTDLLLYFGASFVLIMMGLALRSDRVW